MPAALVLGGTYGIGAAISRRLAAAGFDVAVSARRERPELLSELREAGVRAEFLPGDLDVFEDVERVTDRCLELLGALDVVVVSGKPPSPPPRLFLESDPADFDAHLHAMAVTRLYAARAAAARMRERGGGRIVFLTSDAGRVPTPAESMVGAGAAAVVFATRALARELARHGIRVNAVSLSLTRDTPSWERYQERKGTGEVLWKAFEKIERTAPFGVNEASDVAELVAFLAGEGAGRLSGATISLNGGISFP
jgi:2-hydroxycyclohexanecarboxyl-CoA dehydrogenase